MLSFVVEIEVVLCERSWWKCYRICVDWFILRAKPKAATCHTNALRSVRVAGCIPISAII